MNKLKKWKASFSLGVLNSLEYRLDFFISLLSALFPIIIQICLWLAIYGGTSDNALYGYSFSQMIAYVVIAALVNKVVNTGVENVINDDIHSGGIAKYLTKPIGYVSFRMLYVLGQKLSSVIAIMLCCLITIFVLSFTVNFEIAFFNAALFVATLFLGLILNFFIFFLISMLAFWLTEVGSFFMTIQVVVTVISGGVFPISVLGEGFVTMMKFFPFVYTTYFPAQIFTGAISASDIWTGLVLQVLWIAGLAVLSALVWRTGIRRYVAVGG